MNPNEAVLVERTGNGYVVRPYRPHDGLMTDSLYVFQDKGDVSYARGDSYADPRLCLLGWLDLHFKDPEEKR